GKLSIEASPTGQLAYVTSTASAGAGAVTVEMPNKSGVSHNIAIQQGTSGAVLGASAFTANGLASVKVTLKPGTYTFFCQVPGHRAAGMEGKLTVK
ncbi:MAG TPA: plastocyanin/azurin family copper-binding protein, partial [Solirubrobacteraceae bacterium]|nr:plastocyanin/azurin family copper-binding protein [Solirubrobacteraceae bacterium]